MGALNINDYGSLTYPQGWVSTIIRPLMEFFIKALFLGLVLLVHPSMFCYVLLTNTQQIPCLLRAHDIPFWVSRDPGVRPHHPCGNMSIAATGGPPDIPMEIGILGGSSQGS